MSTMDSQLTAVVAVLAVIALAGVFPLPTGVRIVRYYILMGPLFGFLAVLIGTLGLPLLGLLVASGIDGPMTPVWFMVGIYAGAAPPAAIAGIVTAVLRGRVDVARLRMASATTGFLATATLWTILHVAYDSFDPAQAASYVMPVIFGLVGAIAAFVCAGKISRPGWPNVAMNDRSQVSRSGQPS